MSDFNVEDNKAEHYEYLAKLRDSGATNMFGAGPYLQRKFGLRKRDADEVLFDWMYNFEEGVV